MRSRIMYIEDKSQGLTGPARIGRVTFSQTGSTLRYQGRSYRSLKGRGFKANYVDVETGDHAWISGPRRDGADRLHGGHTPVWIDEDVRAEYWTDVRQQPACAHLATTDGHTHGRSPLQGLDGEGTRRRS